MATARNHHVLLTFFVHLLAATSVASAQYAGGTGTAEDPYQIATAADLIALGETPGDYDKHFILTADIDLDPNLPGRQVFRQAVVAPPGDPQGTDFTGTLDGNWHSIAHLTMRGDANYVGLFGKIGSAGRIRNLRLEDICVDSSGYCIGGLVGSNRGDITHCRLSGTVSGGTGQWCDSLALLAGTNRGRIEDCHASGQVSNGSAERGSRFGLLVGSNAGTIAHCDVDGAVTGGEQFRQIGGLVGENLNNVTDCHSSCNLVANSIYAGTGSYGGLTGANDGVIARCYATGDVSFGKYSDGAGGLVGYNSGRIIACYASVNLSGTFSNWRIGGLVGTNWGYIVHCYATGDVTGVGHIGGLVGSNQGLISHAYAIGRVVGVYNPSGLVEDGQPEDVSRCFWNVETTTRTTSKGGDGLTTAQMQDPSTFLEAGWDLASERANGTSDVWQVPEGGGYPTLTCFSEGHPRRELTGGGTPDDPYLIATAQDLGAVFHNDHEASYEFVADVNLAGIEWTAAVIPYFDGTFDGAGFAISNLTINGGNYLGLFAVLGKHALVEDLGIQNGTILGDNTASGLGLLAVENWGRIANCQISGSVSGGEYEERLGGLVGYNLGTITNCDPVDYDGPSSVIIADPEATRGFLQFEGVDFDDVWIPHESDLEGLDSVLMAYLEPGDHEYILDNLPRYDREYSGFVRRDGRYIICQMILWSGLQGSCYIAEYEPGSVFTIIFDGGCGVVTVIFDAESKTVVSVNCHGMA